MLTDRFCQKKPLSLYLGGSCKKKVCCHKMASSSGQASDFAMNNWKLKRKRKEKKENIIKNKKARGEFHVNHVGKNVSERDTGLPCK